MIRKPLALALGVIIASGGSALAATASSAPAAPITSNMVRTVDNAPACGGKGYTLVTTPSAPRGFICTHAAPDLAAAAGTSMRVRSARPATAKVPCYGDGTTGPRIELVYGFYEGQPNRVAAVTKEWRTAKAARMQAVFTAQSLGRDVGVRFLWTKNCGAISVRAIRFPASVQFDDDGVARKHGELFGRAVEHMIRAGLTRNDRKYMLLWDGFSAPVGGNGVVCGIAQGPHGLADDGPVRHDGVPTVGGRTSPDAPLVDALYPLDRTAVAKYSLTFRRGGGPTGQFCDNDGMSTVSTQIHELMHNLGAVAPGAPNSDGAGHCTDAPSIMCSGDVAGYGLGVKIPACSKVLVETLDCGMDDYWNPNPRPGSYLSTHTNAAQSPFFGAQPQDFLTASPL